MSSFGRIDILVNCAGNFFPKHIYETTEEEWDQIMSVHLKGHFACSKAAMLEMIKQKSGRIINFSSRAATGGGGSPVYSVAKAGILGFTSAVAADLAQFNIPGRRSCLPALKRIHHSYLYTQRFYFIFG
jgi:3-oxoacyl-[acyl-carrier protein] reductase